ncbi:homoserine kinase [Scardovia inopinata]|uniref:Homoserine kinase n=1 Tax=Scardovia inopinata F0304 TaxID=641146 RepID=W5IGR8_SCAIO|nr:homoserine kinase [Scardovia inopinata]EFG26021.2 homoserine kinase [Scardovia inopinata F0304]BAR07349.1 homoserine kinase [Scardovia inopinata JCM 12537]SUV51426.1 homoserine kinase [Scardovia inopinata]
MAISSDVVSVSVPATSANLGSAFDAAGLAVDLRNEATFELLPSTDVDITVHGQGASSLPKDRTNLVVSSFYRACDVFNVSPMGLRIEMTNRLPLSRGLGSSASAIVCGVAAVAAFGDYDLTQTDVRAAIFELASEIEGHPDNAAPCIYGGLTFSWNRDGFHTVSYPVSSQVTICLFIPDFELSTDEARQALPLSVPYSDAVFNLNRSALLPHALASGQQDELFDATDDLLHQQYRGALMPESFELVKSLRAQGFPAFISGAGPSVAVLSADLDSPETIQFLKQTAASSASADHWSFLQAQIDTQGVVAHAA